MRAYTAKEVAAIDRRVTEELGVSVFQLMEVAGLRSAEATKTMVGEGSSVLVLAGPGGNGGDALVAAKWLLLWGFDVNVVLSHERTTLKEVTSHQLRIFENYGGVVIADPPKTPPDLIVDGLLGYSISGAPRGGAATLIRWANASNAPILALDLPSGLDATTGEARDPCIRARKTIVFGLMKQGLLAPSAKPFTGELLLVEIGFPAAEVSR